MFSELYSYNFSPYMPRGVKFSAEGFCNLGFSESREAAGEKQCTNPRHRQQQLHT